MLDCDVSQRQRLVEHALSPVDEFLSVLSRHFRPLRHLVGEAQLVVEQCAQCAVVSAVTQEVQLRKLVLATHDLPAELTLALKEHRNRILSYHWLYCKSTLFC